MCICKCRKDSYVSAPAVSEVRQSDGLAVRLVGRERAKWRYIGAGIVVLHYPARQLMRKFSHRGLSIKKTTTARDGRKKVI